VVINVGDDAQIAIVGRTSLTEGPFMQDTKQRKIAESVFDRKKQREADTNDALAQEATRHAAAVKNMHRLRALRLAREQQVQMHKQTR
jgi:hypothetical protein